MADRPRLLPIVKKKQLRLVPQGELISLISSAALTVLLAVSNALFIFKLLLLQVPPFSHFDPFGTEFYVSRGGSTILSKFRNANFGFRI
jgi:hypothetical protein